MAVAHAADMVASVARPPGSGCVGTRPRGSRVSMTELPAARSPQGPAARAGRSDPGRPPQHRFGPHRLAPIVGVPRSTIGDVLARHGLSRLRDQDGPTGISIRYVRERPASCSTSTSRSWAGSRRGGIGSAGERPARRGRTRIRLSSTSGRRHEPGRLRRPRSPTSAARRVLASSSTRPRSSPATASDRAGPDRQRRTTPCPRRSRRPDRARRPAQDDAAVRPQTNGKAERFTHAGSASGRTSAGMTRTRRGSTLCPASSTITTEQDPTAR